MNLSEKAFRTKFEILPHPRCKLVTPGGKPQRLTARAKKVRALLDRFWPVEPFFCVSTSVCVSVCPSRATSP